MRRLHPESLTAEQVDQAFPLVQMVRPRLGLAGWRARARALLARADAGIVVLRDDAGLMLGLFVWTLDHDPDHGRTLCAADFVARDIVDPDRVADALADALDATARAHGCRAVHTEVAWTGGRARGLVERLGGLGHATESLRLCKTLSGA